MFSDFNDSENQSRCQRFSLTEFGSQVDALCGAAPTVVGTATMAGAAVGCCGVAHVRSNNGT